MMSSGTWQASRRHRAIFPVGQLFRRALGQAIGLGQGLEGHCVLLDQILQPGAQGFGLLQQAFDILLYIGVFLFAQCQVADHAAQGRAQSAAQGRGAAAPGHRLARGQPVQKRIAATC